MFSENWKNLLIVYIKSFV